MFFNRKSIVFIVLLFGLRSLFAQSLTLATANLYAGNKMGEQVTKELLKLDADILILLEWTGGNLLVIKFSDYNLIINEPRSGTHGIGVLVKKKLRATGEIVQNPVSSPCAMPFASVSFVVENKNITVIGVHTPPPIKVCGNATQKTIRAMQLWINDGKLSKDVGSGKKDDSLIVCGDFNSFAFERAIKNFKNIGMTDAVKKSKDFYMGTWSPVKYIPKVVRIDYIFVSKELKLIESKTFKISGSDHRGVIAQIEVD